MQKLITLMGLGAACATTFAGDMVDGLRSGDIWSEPVDVNRQVFAGVRYMRVDENTVRVPSDKGLTMGHLRMGEVLLTWDDEKILTAIQVMIYNKGDDGEADKDIYEELLEDSLHELNAIFGTKGKVCKISRRESAVALKAWEWETEKGVARLEASYTGSRKNFKGEFIRLKLGPDKDSISKGSSADAAHRRDLKSNVKIDELSGDVYIDGIPMVDQGSKGYCVPASAARIFAYYGMDGVDQHALAQLCDSSNGGTSTQDMKSALEAISRKFHMKVICLTGKNETNIIYDFIADYNKAAKKLRKQQATPMDWPEVANDREVLLLARGNKRYVKKWLASIRKNIDAGVPVLWCVTLGIFPEQGIPQPDGSHMRLIIGYNEEKSTLIYSDSWGSGHERKSMPLRHAAAMTFSCYVLRPSR